MSTATMGNLHARYDVVVVGARCAGAATALLLARAGASVLAVDRQPFGSDTQSTHALMRPAVMQLARWGLFDRIVASGAPVIRSTTFHYGDETVTVPIRPMPGMPGLVAPRRAILDRMLVEEARRSGASVMHGPAVRSLSRDARGRVDGVVLWAAGETREIRAGMVVGADGLGSTVARLAGAPTVRRGAASAAVLYRYGRAGPSDGYHWHFGLGESAGVIPTHDGLTCIFVSAPTARYDGLLRHDPEAAFRAILRRAAPGVAAGAQFPRDDRLRVFRGAPAFVRRPAGPGWVLAGDAGFFRDPITSHGISDAFRDAEGAAMAILGGTDRAMRRFEAEREAHIRPVFEATEAICRFDWSLAALQGHHRRFSEALKAQCALLERREAGDLTAIGQPRERETT